MKPIYLKISAFGPYSNVENVDFTKINNELFLISGDTGSGKTTIFDAIVFALYGEASGNIRQSNSLRSDFADDDTETYVELTFECNGREYYIRRSPEYLRKKKKGEGYTKKAADALLRYPDGRTVTKSNIVTENVIDIMGITKEQFTNIAMIAQGDFLKLILAKTEDRSKIFRDIFNTGKFLDIQSRLKSEMFERQDINQKFEESIFQYENDTICNKDSMYYDEHKILSDEKNINRIDEFISIMDKIIKEDEDIKIRLEGTRKKYEELYKNASDLLRLYKEKNDKATEIIKLENIIKNDCIEIENKKLLLEEHSAGREERDKKYIVYNDIKSKLEEYEQLDVIIKKEKTLKTDYENQNNILINLRKDAEKLNSSLEQLKLSEKEYNKVLNKLSELKLRKSDCVNKNNLLEEIIRRKKNIDKLNICLNNDKKKYLDIENKVKDAKAAADEKEKCFLRAQAGIMAADLEDGMECPVCGSISHPKPAKLSLESATQEEVKAARKSANDLVKLLEKASIDCSHTKGKLETEKSMYEESCRKIKNLDDDKEVESLYDSIREEISAIEKQMSEYNRFIIENGDVSERILKCEEKISQNTSDMQKNSEYLNDFLVEIAKTNAEMNKIRQGLKYSTKREAEEEIKKLYDDIKKYDKLSENLTDNLRKLSEEKKESEGQLKAFNKEIQNIDEKISENINELSDKKKYGRELNIDLLSICENDSELPDFHTIISVKSSVEDKLSEFENNVINTEYRIRNNEKAVQNIKKTYNDRKNIISEYLTYRKLSNVANGMISGKDKITFERYVQGTYFEYIINAANKRLIEMTDGRYELLKKKDNNLKAQTGLELDIRDAYTGKVRGVNTLSGGEAFKASLSMALGLSDVVQEYAGGIKLDSMFIDEGFGSLDHESLDKAINILNDLSDGKRMIGIISHISELNERIDKKIHINKSNEGSKIQCLF